MVVPRSQARVFHILILLLFCSRKNVKRNVQVLHFLIEKKVTLYNCSNGSGFLIQSVYNSLL